jgi:hypothetical protein
MSRVLVDALEEIAADNVHDAMKTARDALAAHRASPLAGDEVLVKRLFNAGLAMAEVREVLRIVDKHLRGER